MTPWEQLQEWKRQQATPEAAARRVRGEAAWRAQQQRNYDQFSNALSDTGFGAMVEGFNRTPNLTTNLRDLAMRRSQADWNAAYGDKEYTGRAARPAQQFFRYVGGVGKKLADPAALGIAAATGGTAAPMLAAGGIEAFNSGAQQYLGNRKIDDLAGIGIAATTGALGGRYGDSAGAKLAKAAGHRNLGIAGETGGRVAGGAVGNVINDMTSTGATAAADSLKENKPPAYAQGGRIDAAAAKQKQQASKRI